MSRGTKTVVPPLERLAKYPMGVRDLDDITNGGIPSTETQQRSLPRLTRRRGLCALVWPLTVGLSGKPSKAWRQRVESVVERLGRDGVEVKKERVVVSGVETGREGDVRHLLESAALQANADLAPDEPEDEGDQASETDREMTQVFRAFS